MLNLLKLLVNLLDSTSAATKWSAALVLGWSLSPILLFLERHVFDDWQFLVAVAVVVACDTVLGVLVAIKAKRLSSLGLRRVFVKVAVYGIVILGSHTAARHTVQGELNDVLTWLDSVVYAAVMVTEMLSILENAMILHPVKAFRLIARRLEAFNDQGEPNPQAKQE